MKLYLVRHGEACTKEVDRIIHSGKLRAQQTAECLAKDIGPEVELETNGLLNPNDHPKAFDWQSGSWNRDTLKQMQALGRKRSSLSGLIHIKTGIYQTAFVVLILILVSITGGRGDTVQVTQDVRISNSSDDAEEGDSGSFSVTSTDLELVAKGSIIQTVGLRFNGIEIPQGGQVLSATIQFQVDQTSAGNASLTIQGEAADNAGPLFDLDASLSQRETTLASISWSPPAWRSVGKAGPDQKTPDIAPVIQEIVNRPGWQVGHSLTIIIAGTGVRVAEAYDGDGSSAPLLHLEYVLSDQEAPAVDAGPDQSITLANSAILNGSISDDGRPNPPGMVATIWSQLSGPGTVTFDDAAATNTSASFSLAGTYVLRLTATDSERIVRDEISVTVNPAIASPAITSFTPGKAQVATTVFISGSHFSDVQNVYFNGVSATFWIPADNTIYAIVPAGVTTGPITVTNLTGSMISTADFTPTFSPTVLVGAGDIGRCDLPYDEATADLLDTTEGVVITLGDNVYAGGTDSEFSACYDRSWGRYKWRTRPSPGNHDYQTTGASGYYNYFGAVAGEPGKGYYSYDVGVWHVIVLNSECEHIGGCDSASPQGQWLQADLAENPSICTLAYWHRPRFSSGYHGNNVRVDDFWHILYAAGAELVLNGHDHDYERFAPQDPNGNADPDSGIRQIVVGTGGTVMGPIIVTEANSEVRNGATHGVIKITLHPTSYDWEFIPVAGQTFTDSGSDSCH